MPSLEQNFSHVKNSFSACHFLVGFKKCERLHGHNYAVTVNFRYVNDDLSSAIDFRLVNAAIQHELKQLNQKILLPEDSKNIKIHSSFKGKNWNITVDNAKTYSFPKQDTIILEGIKQTTTESLAFYLHQKLCAWLQKDHSDIISTLDITIAENLGNQAKYSGSCVEIR